MSALPRPDYQVQVSPDFAKYRLALALRSPADDQYGAPHEDFSDVAGEDLPANLPKVVVPGGAFETVRLRRDGDRPLSISASLILVSETRHQVDENPSVNVTRKVALYAREGGGLAAHVFLEPSMDCPTRPVSRAILLDTILALDALIDESVFKLPLGAELDDVSTVKSLSEVIRASTPPFFACAKKSA